MAQVSNYDSTIGNNQTFQSNLILYLAKCGFNLYFHYFKTAGGYNVISTQPKPLETQVPMDGVFTVQNPTIPQATGKTQQSLNE
jgi:hypothetical protein